MTGRRHNTLRAIWAKLSWHFSWLSTKDGLIMYTGLDRGWKKTSGLKENYNEFLLVYLSRFYCWLGFFVANMSSAIVVENFHQASASQGKEEKLRVGAKRARRMEKKRSPHSRRSAYWAGYSRWRTQYTAFVEQQVLRLGDSYHHWLTLKLLKMAKGIKSVAEHGIQALRRSVQPGLTVFILFFIFARWVSNLFGKAGTKDELEKEIRRELEERESRRTNGKGSARTREKGGRQYRQDWRCGCFRAATAEVTDEDIANANDEEEDLLPQEAELELELPKPVLLAAKPHCQLGSCGSVSDWRICPLQSKVPAAVS
uniref:Ion_trans domain-containing protein n=1 Tax=Macrostomum lignano TaxID=282301 RepID=A0A1I8FP50_9PLAT